MKEYQFLWQDGSPRGKPEKLRALNVIFAWQQFCEKVMGYLTSHELQFRGIIGGKKNWTISSFGRHHDPSRNILLITTTS